MICARTNRDPRIVPEEERVDLFEDVAGEIRRMLPSNEIAAFEAARRHVWSCTGARWALTPRRVFRLIRLALALRHAPQFAQEGAA